ncbi:MAG TPA: phosphoglycerate mutase family protein [Gaiellaceae bacterium]|nr:phosphoglycerate mutase family protein [Gaiellaceae bacterium]
MGEGVEAAAPGALSLLLRHASAGSRRRWEGDDKLRSLDARGCRQAEALVELLLPFGVRRVVSSPYVRCVETVGPLAAALGVEVELDDRLAEGAGGSALELLREDGVVVCTHGDVIEHVLDRGLKKGAAVFLRGGVVAGEIPAP